MHLWSFHCHPLPPSTPPPPSPVTGYPLFCSLSLPPCVSGYPLLCSLSKCCTIFFFSSLYSFTMYVYMSTCTGIYNILLYNVLAAFAEFVFQFFFFLNNDNGQQFKFKKKLLHKSFKKKLTLPLKLFKIFSAPLFSGYGISKKWWVKVGVVVEMGCKGIPPEKSSNYLYIRWVIQSCGSKGWVVLWGMCAKLPKLCTQLNKDK